MQPADEITIPADHYFMMGDNRGERRQPLLGTSPPRLDHRQGICHVLAAEEGRHLLRAGKRAAARLFRFDRSFGSRFVAGVDEAGRGSLAGPLLAAGVLIDLERIGRSERRALAHLDDSKQKSPEEREALYPHVIRAAACFRSRCARCAAIDTRGLHVSNLAALSECMRAIAPPDAVCLVDGFRLPGVRRRAHRGRRRRRAQRGDRGGLGDRQGHARPLHAPRVAELYPGWEFETNVGYSTPEHREAIMANGICPLHRRSFASVAYSQLDLTGAAG